MSTKIHKSIYNGREITGGIGEFIQRVEDDGSITDIAVLRNIRTDRYGQIVAQCGSIPVGHSFAMGGDFHWADPANPFQGLIDEYVDARFEEV